MSELNREQEKKNDLLKELEIQSILDETHQLADDEKMKKIADKYRAKPKMADIFSNADKKPRLKNDNPLDLDKEKPDESNAIVDDKTAATMQTELIMDGSKEDIKTPEQLEKEAEEAAKKAAEEAAKKAEEEKIVTLAPEYDEGTQFSGEVLGAVMSSPGTSGLSISQSRQNSLAPFSSG